MRSDVRSARAEGHAQHTTCSNQRLPPPTRARRLPRYRRSLRSRMYRQGFPCHFLNSRGFPGRFLNKCPVPTGNPSRYHRQRRRKSLR